jgi:hypothetical protein
MKLIKFLLVSIIGIALVLILSTLVFLQLPNKYQNSIVKSVGPVLLNYIELDAKFDDASLDLANNIVHLNNVKVNLSDTKITMPEVLIKYGIPNKLWNFDIDFLDPLVNDKPIKASFNLKYSSNLNFQHKSFIVNILHNGSKSACHINFDRNKINIKSCDIDLYGSKLNLTGDIEKSNSDIKTAKIAAKFDKLELLSYKLLKIFLPRDDALNVLDDFILGGNMSGNIEIDLDQNNNYEINERNLTGNIILDDVKIKYDRDFPVVENIKANASIKGKSIDCEILGANSNQIQIKDGKISFDWKEGQNSSFNVNLNAESPASNIAYFINEEQKQKLKNNGIDFATTAGKLEANIKAIVPISPEKPINLNIDGKAKGFGLNGFQDKVRLTNADLKFLITMSDISAEGSGMLNNYSSKLSYHQDIPYTNSEISADITLANLNNLTEDLVSFDGTTVLNVRYKDVNNNTSVSAKADLTKVGIEIKRFSLAKDKNRKCLLEINNTANSDEFKFKVSGSENFNTGGSFNIAKQILQLDYLNSDTMNVQGKIKFSKNKVTSDITGKHLNLSNYNLFNFLKKNPKGGSTETKMHFDQINLKNDIMLSNFDLELNCTPEKCSKGSIKGLIQGQPISILLTTNNSHEDWDLESKNAGVFFKGTGIYNKIQDGTMYLNISTKRSNVKPGEMLPIMQGKLAIRNFSAIKNPVLTKIVAMTSIPGLFNVLTNNKEIKFDKLDAVFNFYTDSVRILDCKILGSSFDLMLKGNINLNERQVKLNGIVVPSLYGINSVLSKVPLVGQLIYSGKRKGIILKDFEIKEKY